MCGLAVHDLHNTLRSLSRTAYASIEETRIHNELVRLVGDIKLQIDAVEKACGLDLDRAKTAADLAREFIRTKDRRGIHTEVQAVRGHLEHALKRCVSPPEKIIFTG